MFKDCKKQGKSRGCLPLVHPYPASHNQPEAQALAGLKKVSRPS